MVNTIRKYCLNLAVVAMLLLLLASCKKDPPQKEQKYGKLLIRFENYVGDSLLWLDHGNYLNAVGNNFNVSMLRYYVSNISLKGSRENSFKKYFLIDEAKPSSLYFEIDSIETGSYNTLGFMLGVDSARNVSGAQTGALDPANGMFWDWNTGYIMARMEGVSPQSGAFGDNLIFHIAGFEGEHKVQKMIWPEAGILDLVIKEERTTELTLKMNLLEWFASPNKFSFDTLHTVTEVGLSAKMIADNYASMFSVKKIVNP